jgi:hypothetical protein
MAIVPLTPSAAASPAQRASWRYNPYRRRLRRQAWLIAMAGAVGALGAGLGWDSNRAAPTLFLGAGFFAMLLSGWLLWTVSMMASLTVAYSRPGGLVAGLGPWALAFLRFGLARILTLRGASHWLYVSLASFVLAEAQLAIWANAALRRWRAEGSQG